MQRCLIVDDSKVIRMVARKIIQELGFDTDEAGDGVEALESCGKTMPEAVLLDWNMPGMNGVDFLRRLRALPGGDAPVVVFCAAEDDSTHIGEAMASGANGHIMKPFDSAVIRDKFVEVGLLEAPEET